MGYRREHGKTAPETPPMNDLIAANAKLRGMKRKELVDEITAYIERNRHCHDGILELIGSEVWVALAERLFTGIVTTLQDKGP